LGENYFPADTLIVPVIQSVHRQPDLYDDLESFRRERFLQQRPISPLSIRGEKPVHFDAGPSSPATAPPCAPVDPSDIEVVRVRIAQDPS
jgi:hypothetical protein